MGKSRGPAHPDDVHRLRLEHVRWPHLFAIAGLHVACLAAPFTFTWGAFVAALVVGYFAGSFGISMGFHRLLTHHSFRTPKWFRYVLATIGTLTWQGGPIWWVGTHRIHHAESDQEMDPHSPHHGFGWGHVLWAVVDDPYGRDLRDGAKDLQKEPYLVWLDRWFMVPQIVLALALYLAGGWPWVIWAIAVRTVASYHATWFVNSASHLWGYRTFDTPEQSKNNWWVALIAWGEGWHNNHHAKQRSASFWVRWWEVDITYAAIVVLSWFGLTREIVPAASPE